MVGTGAEDYIGTGWGQGRFINRYQGCIYADQDKKRFSFYRFHAVDPVYFQENIKITIQQIGCTVNEDIQSMIDNGLKINWTNGEEVAYDCKIAVFERFEDYWCSIAYLYLQKPYTDLPDLPTYDERIEKYH